MTEYVHPAAGAGDDLSPVARDTLRQVVASDTYAATFQSLRQYRLAILQHIDNLRDPASRQNTAPATGEKNEH